MNTFRKNVALLASCQALLFINNTTVISVNALLGARLAKATGLSSAFATVPAMCWVIGAAAAAMPAAQLMKRVGRRNGFTAGPLLGLLGALTVSGAIVFSNFYLLCLGTLVLVEANDAPRSTGALVRQPKFAIAVLVIALGYAVMNLLMVSTPLAMTAHCGHPYGAAASVIGFHVIGMFAPSLFTGTLIKRFGTLRVMAAGVLFNCATVIVALSGVTVAHFWWALFLLGVGWNFLYIGGTTLLTETYRPSERARAQGISEVCTFSVMVVSSLSSGVLLEARGWSWLAYVSAALIAVVAGAVAALWIQPSESVA